MLSGEAMYQNNDGNIDAKHVSSIEDLCIFDGISDRAVKQRHPIKVFFSSMDSLWQGIPLRLRTKL